MNKCILLVLGLFMATITFSQNKAYDSVLAQQIGADQYGMKQYVIAFLKAGTAKITDTAQRTQLMKGHMKNIGRMAKEGTLVLAGPFLDKGNFAGIYIFNVKTIEEARKLTISDPAVKAGIFDMELHPWYGSAALMQLTSLHNKVQKSNVTD